jgi:GR25 family glycosyltransferase involved in LPS biosynthesis
MLPTDPLDLNIIVLCGGNTARYHTMKERLKEFHNVYYYDNTGYLCTEGHERMLTYVMNLNSDHDYILIMEDDACLMETFFDLYPKLLEIDRGSEPYDLLYLGGNLLNPPVRKISENIYETKPISLYATHAYIIRKTAYQTAIDLIIEDKHRYIVDDIYTRSSLKTLFVCPPMVTQLPPEGNLERNLLLHNIMMKGYKEHIGL